MDISTIGQPEDVCRRCGKKLGILDTKYRIVMVEVKPMLYGGFPVFIGLDKVLTDDNVMIKENVCSNCIDSVKCEIYSHDEGEMT